MNSRSNDMTIRQSGSDNFTAIDSDNDIVTIIIVESGYSAWLLTLIQFQ